MASIVVPFRGRAGKQRLAPLSEEGRSRLALAMLTDVLAACEAVGRTLLVTSDPEARELHAQVVDDPGGGQGAAVASALRDVDEWPALVVNADVPCVEPRDLYALLGALPAGGLALVRARDGTTNALALSAPHVFAPLYGPGSADRFRERAVRLGVELVLANVPNLAEDVDTLADLERLEPGAGPRTRQALVSIRVGTG